MSFLRIPYRNQRGGVRHIPHIGVEYKTKEKDNLQGENQLRYALIWGQQERLKRCINGTMYGLSVNKGIVTVHAAQWHGEEV